MERRLVTPRKAAFSKGWRRQKCSLKPFITFYKVVCAWKAGLTEKNPGTSVILGGGFTIYKEDVIRCNLVTETVLAQGRCEGGPFL